MPLDSLQRPLSELRLSVTDRCNFRCRYCMPREHYGAEHPQLGKSELLSYEEIDRLVFQLVGLGVRKVRLTGGEPLVRRDLPRLVKMLRRNSQVDLALTTNGVLLPPLAQRLKDSGLDRLTVSLDALDSEVFRRISDSTCNPMDVLEGVAAAERAGFSSLKINCVVRRDVNAGEVLPLVEHFRGTPHELRFIEYMDVGVTNGWKPSQVMLAPEILALIEARYPLDPVSRSSSSATAHRYRYRDGQGFIGIVTSVSDPFCGGCTRLRVSADGKLFTCLFASKGTDFRALLRSGVPDSEITSQLQALWVKRADRYSETRSGFESAASGLVPSASLVRGVTAWRPEMSYIGG